MPFLAESSGQVVSAEVLEYRLDNGTITRQRSL